MNRAANLERCTICPKLPKMSLLTDDTFSSLKHELVTENFCQFPYFPENLPKSSLFGPQIAYRIGKFLTTWQPWFCNLILCNLQPQRINPFAADFMKFPEKKVYTMTTDTLAPDDTKPFPEPILTNPQWRPFARAISHEMHNIYIYPWYELKICNWRLQLRPLGHDE